ncbi:MAG: toll/interleukin-1 receptor domain-containing protein [Candidatus Zixiibacteriota bacterium]
MKKKLFISHASEDKDDFVRPLAEALSRDFDVWYDEHQLVVGCSLLEEISKGLANGGIGPAFLRRFTVHSSRFTVPAAQLRMRGGQWTAD